MIGKTVSMTLGILSNFSDNILQEKTTIFYHLQIKCLFFSGQNLFFKETIVCGINLVTTKQTEKHIM